MKRAVFVAGTDTGIGKTWVSAGLVTALRAAGIDAVGMKPVASGCEPSPSGWRNEDALALLRASGLGETDYTRINPVALPLPVAPHIAAARAGMRIDIANVRDAYVALQAQHEVVVVEGAGGWSIPLSDHHMQADLVRALELPVLLVVGLRLGCINHALLTARAIAGDGLRLLGWLGNMAQPVDDQRDVLATLDARMPMPGSGVIAHGEAVSTGIADTVIAALAS